MDTSAKMLLTECTNVLVQVEVHPKFKAEFQQKHLDLTGRKLCGQSFLENAKLVRCDCTVWFRGSDTVANNFRMLGYQVDEFHRGEFNFCARGEKLFWLLARNGFSVGDNQSEAKRRMEEEAVAALGACQA